MASFEIKDPTLELVASMSGALSINGPKFRPVLDALYNLNLELPMSTYNIVRVGVTNVWNVTATAKDTRSYSSTVSIPANTPKYTLTNLPAATSNELTVFLALIQTFATVLKTFAFASVSIEWT